MTETTVRRTACNLCEAICGILVTVADGPEGPTVTDIRGDEADPLSKGHICPKAVALRDLQTDPDRLRKPVRRTADGWAELEWDEAYDLVARRLTEVQAEHGTVDQLPHQLAVHLLYGHQLMVPVADIDRTSYLLMLGANPLASNGSMMTAPGFARRLKAVQARGGKVVVIDPRRTETASVADEHHFIRPGADAAFLLALLHQVLADGVPELASYVDGLEQVREAVAEWTPERAGSAVVTSAGGRAGSAGCRSSAVSCRRQRWPRRS